jgi:hypothetical protein
VGVRRPTARGDVPDRQKLRRHAKQEVGDAHRAPPPLGQAAGERRGYDRDEGEGDDGDPAGCPEYWGYDPRELGPCAQNHAQRKRSDYDHVGRPVVGPAFRSIAVNIDPHKSKRNETAQARRVHNSANLVDYVIAGSLISKGRGCALAHHLPRPWAPRVGPQSKTVRAAKALARTHGGYIGKPPYGYTLTPEMVTNLDGRPIVIRRPTPDPGEAETVRRIVREVSNGAPLGRIAADLNREEVPTRGQATGKRMAGSAWAPAPWCEWS